MEHLTQAVEFYHAHARLIHALGATGFGAWLAWKAIIKWGIPKIVDAIMDPFEDILKGLDPRDGKPIVDPIFRKWLFRVVAATVEAAEEAFPDEGMGEQKMRMVLERIYSLGNRVPLIGPKVELRLRSQEPRLKEFIETFVAKMNERLKKDRDLPSADVPPAAAS